MGDDAQQMPLVSVAVPVYNGERFVGRALDSLALSDYPNLEVVICDNASTDGTEQICRAFADRDARFRYVRNPTNRGASANFEKAFWLSRGKYFRWLAHDDWCSADYDSRCVAELEAHPDAVLAFSGQAVIDDDAATTKVYTERMSEMTDPDPVRRLRSVVWSLQDPTAPVFGLMRSEALRQTGRIRNAPEPDRVLLYELCLYGTFRVIDAPLFLRYRPHGHALHYGTGRPGRRSFEWLHPANVGKPRIATARVLAAEIASVRRAPLPVLARGLCTWHLLSSAAVRRPRAKWRSRQRFRRLAEESRRGVLSDPGRD